MTDAVWVTLASGGTLTLLVSVNVFSLSKTDREFVYELVDKLREYQEKHPTEPLTPSPS